MLASQREQFLIGRGRGTAISECETSIAWGEHVAGAGYRGPFRPFSGRRCSQACVDDSRLVRAEHVRVLLLPERDDFDGDRSAQAHLLDHPFDGGCVLPAGRISDAVQTTPGVFSHHLHATGGGGSTSSFSAF